MAIVNVELWAASALVAADAVAESLAKRKPGAWTSADEEAAVHVQVVDVDNETIEVYRCDDEPPVAMAVAA